jgi:hypothetical protein
MEIVEDHDHGLCFCEQTIDKVAADKACPTGYDHSVGALIHNCGSIAERLKSDRYRAVENTLSRQPYVPIRYLEVTVLDNAWQRVFAKAHATLTVPCPEHQGSGHIACSV